MVGKPSVIVRATNRVDVFARGGDAAVWTKSLTAGFWSTFTQVAPNQTLASPSVTSRQPGRLDLFVEGMDHGLHTNVFNGTSWGGYASLGGSIH